MPNNTTPMPTSTRRRPLDLRGFQVPVVDLDPDGVRALTRTVWFASVADVDRWVGILICDHFDEDLARQVATDYRRTIRGLCGLIGQRFEEVRGAPVAVCEAHLAVRKLMPRALLHAVAGADDAELEGYRARFEKEPKQLMVSPLRELTITESVRRAQPRPRAPRTRGGREPRDRGHHAEPGHGPTP